MQKGLPIERKAAGAVRHQALALRGTDCLAEVGFGMQTVIALAAFGGIQGNDVIAFLQGFNTRAHVDNDTGAFMAKNGGKLAFRVVTAQSECIGVAYAGGFQFNKNFPGLWTFEVDFTDFEGPAGGNGDCCASFHAYDSLCVL